MAFLEDYTYLEQLGQGGYATVYKVRHNKFRYIRALRVLNATIAQGENDPIYQKFLEECALLLRLGNGCHPNIVHIYQPLLKAQKAIVEMDYVDGQDLYHYLSEQKGFIPVDDVICLVTQIGSALAYCHHDIYEFCMDREEDNLQDDPNDGSKVLMDNATQQRLIDKYRIIHNDIHSGNIIRRRNGIFVLLDFGLAIEGSDVVRSSRRRNGAPEFKAPEKWEDEAVLTPQSDIYSFGVVLFEYLTGRVPFPFDKSTSNQIKAEYLLSEAHKEQTPPAIFELRKAAFEAANPGVEYKKDYPDWLETLIMKCLEKEPSNRFANAKELYEFAIENINNPQQSKPVAVPVPIIEEPLDVDDDTPLPPASVESVDTIKEPSVESGPLEGAPEADSSQFEPIPVPTNTKKSSNKWILGFILLAIIAIGGYFLYPLLRDEYNSYLERKELEETFQLQQQEVEKYGKEEFVDLGLPSGTLWYGKNQGNVDTYYTYDEAVSKFGDNLPIWSQLEELKEKCTWTWVGHGYKVVGPNGNSIYLPAAGYRSGDGDICDVDSYAAYWSSTPNGSENAYYLYFNPEKVGIGYDYFNSGRSVCLVQNVLTDYVDLGLPSGTLWSAENEGGDSARCTYDEAVNKFGNKLPTKEQLQELKDKCTWTWTGSGYKVVGPNGNSIYLPATGLRSCEGNVYGGDSDGYYWSSTPNGSVYAYILGFDSDEVDVFDIYRCGGFSVRLVQNVLMDYVDLGLPSGTLWSAENEGGDSARYTYDEAVNKFGNKLPTKEQLQELKDKCTWTWTGSGYKVVGPNGNSIYLPAAGGRYCNGFEYGEGFNGSYWSSTPDGSDLSYLLGFDSDDVNMDYYIRCGGLSVRLVQD